jgi:hypothetical protein
VEHTQMDLALKRVQRNSIILAILGIFSEFTFSWNKNFNGGYEGPSVL